MGGFLLTPVQHDSAQFLSETNYESSLAVFEKKRLSPSATIRRDDFTLHLFHKRLPQGNRFVEFPNGDFLAYTGTLLIDGLTGTAALQRYYERIVTTDNADLEYKLTGSFALFVYHRHQLTLITDYLGYYPVYRHEKTGALSNSFLSLARIKGAGGISPYGLYEFVLNGFFTDEQTVLEGISVLDSQRCWQLYPGLRSAPRSPPSKPISPTADFEETAIQIHAQLRDHFSGIEKAYSGQIGSALSGGFDSRHMLALLRSVGATPYLYVYGSDKDADVLVAKEIAKHENLALIHTNKAAFPKTDPESFAQAIDEAMYFFDGIKPMGVIDDGSDLFTRMTRAAHATLQLNGAGGEIYREIWNIGDKNTSLTTFLRMRFDRGAYAFFRDGFDHEEYFDRFTNKIKRMLKIDRCWISRSEAEMLFPLLRNKFAAINNSANAQITDSLLPYMEPKFAIPSYEVPIHFKYCGRLQARLIELAWPSLAGYMSSYGIRFSSPPPVKYRMNRALERHVPLPVRTLKRKISARRDKPKPYFLNDDYVKEVLDTRQMATADLVDIRLLRDPEDYSRLLSVELLLKYAGISP